MGLFHRGPRTEPVLLLVTLNDRLMPLQRGARYEDPLDELLRDAKLGQVAGGGTLQQRTGEIATVDIEVSLREGSPETVALVVEALERLGAPRGSSYTLDGVRADFGSTEGLGLYVNGTDLPPEVYAASDINGVIARLEVLVADAGELHGTWEGESETGVYFYGPSYAAMLDRIRAYVGETPLLERARVEQVA
jgi:hypothetical protein